MVRLNQPRIKQSFFVVFFCAQDKSNRAVIKFQEFA